MRSGYDSRGPSGHRDVPPRTRLRSRAVHSRTGHIARCVQAHAVTDRARRPIARGLPLDTSSRRVQAPAGRHPACRRDGNVHQPDRDTSLHRACEGLTRRCDGTGNQPDTCRAAVAWNAGGALRCGSCGPTLSKSLREDSTASRSPDNRMQPLRRQGLAFTQHARMGIWPCLSAPEPGLPTRSPDSCIGPTPSRLRPIAFGLLP